MRERTTMTSELIVGIDLGDRMSHFAVLSNATGEILEEGKIRTRQEALLERFSNTTRMRIVIEAGSHSPWVSRLLSQAGHEVIVANPRDVRAIYSSKKKTDRFDAVKLAQLGRVDVRLLHPIEHRTEEQQADLAVIRSRDALVKSRTLLVNHVRGSAKAFGVHLQRCNARTLARKGAEILPASLLVALGPVLESIESIDDRIREFDRTIEALARERYPETELLTQVYGVGPLTALSFVLVLGRSERFRRARSVGSYLGLVPRLDSSGDQNPELGITKQGNKFLRRLLVNSAQTVLRKNSPDSDLKRFGNAISARGGKRAKKRAAVAVARKLAVLLFRLWRNGEVWQPQHQTETPTRLTSKVA